MANNEGASADDSSHHHHHEYIHDRSITNFGTIGNVATGDGHCGDMVATQYGLSTFWPRPWILLLLLTIGAVVLGIWSSQQHPTECKPSLATLLAERTNVHIKIWTNGTVWTSSLGKVMDRLNNGASWITIKGSPGEGKTTVAYMALDELKKSGRDVFQVKTPEEFTEVILAYSRPVIMLDDILGDLDFEHDAWQRWKPAIQQVLGIEEHRSHILGNEVVNNEKGVILLVGRDYVIKSGIGHMGKLADFFVNDLHVVDMSHAVERSLEEKQKIWKAVVESTGITLHRYQIDRIFDLKGNHGFPHVCRLFVTMFKSNDKIDAEQFFKTPLKFLSNTIKGFLENDSKLALFKEMIKRNGKVSQRELEETDSSYVVIKTAKDLLCTYLRMEDGYFIFDHPSIYDSVAFNLCNYQPLFVIENCKLSFIHQRLRLELLRDAEHEPLNTETELVIYISHHYTGDLAKRFAAEISKGNIFLVLSHHACADETLVSAMMSRLAFPLDELLTMTDSQNGLDFLTLSVSNKSPQLLTYIEKQTNKKLSKKEMRNIMYIVCTYAASSVLVYLRNTNHVFDINFQYGDAQQTPLMLAAETRDSKIVDQIMSLDPDLNARDRYGQTTFHYLCEYGQAAAVKQMIDKGTDINIKDSWGLSPVYFACWYNEVEVVRLLLQSGATIDGETVGLACNRGNMEVIDMLFENGARPNMDSALFGSPLLQAFLGRQFTVIQYLIDKGASVNPKQDLFGSPLHAACYSKMPQAVNYLIKHGADINRRDFLGNAPLHKAAQFKCMVCLVDLLKAGCNINVQNAEGCTPLHEAARMGFTECVDVLLKAGADVSLQNNDGCTPLHEATKMGFTECVDVLLKAGADVSAQSREGYTPLHFSAQKGYKRCSEVLIKAGANVSITSIYGFTPFHMVAEDGSKECVDLLIKAGADVNVQSNNGYTPLHRAAEKGCKNCVDVLLGVGADVNVQDENGNTPLHKAAGIGSKVSVDVLLKGGADVNIQSVDGYTPLHEATVRKSKECIDVLLKAGADVNVRSKKGFTPLHVAAWTGSTECISVLLNAGADLHAQSKDGITPLHRAAETGSKEGIGLLLKAGANVNVQCKDGFSPLHYAAVSGSKDCVDVLLTAGVDVNVQSNNGYTPLHGAVIQEATECVDALIKAGADVFIQSKDGHTPLDYMKKDIDDDEQSVNVENRKVIYSERQ